ncbi:hypothetical protein SDC9_167853 [bioreactor metagenome]|uniref:Uncharacterized protein n=1 Tax=bioreactor metagenome TaxID=1076179 RepID=A0A645G8Q4_9ZZZZ
MVADGAYPVPAQPFAYCLDIFTRRGVDDAGYVGKLPDILHQRGVLVGGMLDVEKQVFTVEPRRQREGLPQREL